MSQPCPRLTRPEPSPLPHEISGSRPRRRAASQAVPPPPGYTFGYTSPRHDTSGSLACLEYPRPIQRRMQGRQRNDAHRLDHVDRGATTGDTRGMSSSQASHASGRPFVQTSNAAHRAANADLRIKSDCRSEGRVNGRHGPPSVGRDTTGCDARSGRRLGSRGTPRGAADSHPTSLSRRLPCSS